jgi:KipI family sensor histidine kinase inhibitor
VRFLRCGPAAVLIELDDLTEAQALRAEVERRRTQGWAPGLRDIVPGARTLLLDGVDDLAGLAREISAWPLPERSHSTGPVIEVPCRYTGPDIAEVAAQWRVAEADVARIHSSALHEVAFCGFGPGFAYMTAIGEQRNVTRRASPRTKVPAGSVALADLFTGIYPRSSPGGWRLIGHTDAVLWDPAREPAALLQPGRLVRFIPVKT